MFRKIQGKLVFLYFCLVLIIMIATGSFLITSIKNYLASDYLTKVNSLIQGNRLAEQGYGVEDLKGLETFINDQMLKGKMYMSADDNYYILAQKTGVVLYTNDKNVRINSPISIPGTAVRQAMAGRVSTIDGSKAINGNYIEYASPVIAKNGHKYVLYIRASNNKDYATLNQIIGYIVIGTMAALLLSIGLGFLFASTLTGPIKDLTAKAQEIASGKFESRIKVRSNDEIGVLTATFNHMASQLKKNLEQISSEKTKVETILRNLADGVIAFDANGEMIHANHSARKMLKLQQEDFAQKTLNDILGMLDITTNEDIYNLPIDDKIVKVWQNGENVIRVYVASIKDESGNNFGAVVVFQDITEQYKLDNMRKEFVANVSHELRTPITTVKSYTETLIDGAMEDKEVATDFLNVIDSETERMTRLINDLLQLSKFDYKYASMQIKSFEIYNMVRECIAKLTKLAGDKNQIINHQIPDAKLIINGDRDRLEQVVINILSNAIKYTKENGTILVKAYQEDSFVFIKIKDSGIGIPPEDVGRIFERFYRVDKARSRAMGGTGLGLSIAKEIIDAHGGTINVESEVGTGTTMTIKIPVNIVKTDF